MQAIPKVFQLGYVSLGVSDIEESRDHYLRTMGVTETDRSEDGTTYASIGLNHHDLVLSPAIQPGQAQIGLQLTPDIDLADFASDVKAFGLRAEIKSDSQPGIGTMVEVVGPDDYVIQFYRDADLTAPGYAGAGISPLRLGHVALMSPKADELVTFFREFLGFYKTDQIGDRATFLTCNHEHHVLNIVNSPETLVHHIAFQLHESADHVRAADTLRSHGKKTVWGPSRHTAGHNLAAYHLDPDKVIVELYTDMDIYLPAADCFEQRPWHEDTPQRPKVWGPQLSAWEVDFLFSLGSRTAAD
ncbi:MAG: VOC family protein [Pseudomonadota bacterium]